MRYFTYKNRIEILVLGFYTEYILIIKQKQINNMCM